MQKPDFFIVGAPKCGTTSLYRYLERHPDVFLPQEKELNYFSSDLFPAGYISESQYCSLFKDAHAEQLIGEASVWYLFSEIAASKIYEFSPEAKIIVMLRNPVEMLYSLHSQHYFQGMEDVKDFKSALEMELLRKCSKNTTTVAANPKLLAYRDIASYSVQVERYISVFGQGNVHVILYDDFKIDPLGVYRRVLAFLGLNQGVEPNLHIYNANKQPRSMLFRRLTQLPAWLMLPLRKILPFQMRRRLLSAIEQKNVMYVKREPLDRLLGKGLCDEFRPDIERLAAVIDRNLDAWISQYNTSTN